MKDKWRLILALILGTSLVQAGSQGTGGSNYLAYDRSGCDFSNYGVVENYAGLAVFQINSQLSTMYSNGQRKLRLPIFYSSDSDYYSNNLNLQVSSGDLTSTSKTRLANLLAQIDNVGFNEIMISFHPQGCFTDPHTWTVTGEGGPAWTPCTGSTTFNPANPTANSYFNENWTVIQSVRTIAASSGIQYSLDLYNEGIPSGSSDADFPGTRAYGRALWAEYTSSFGKNNTVGFSIIANDFVLYDLGDMMDIMADIYDDDFPYVTSLHVYHNSGEEEESAGAQMEAVDNAFDNEPGLDGVGFVVGEAYYNDESTADSINEYQTDEDLDRTIWWLAQWPTNSAGSCVAPPSSFGDYSSNGF